MTGRCIIALSVAARLAWGQQGLGELRLTVLDASGARVNATADVESRAAQVRRSVRLAEGGGILRALPYGEYRLEVTRPGFTPHVEGVRIESALPVERRITLAVEAPSTTVLVREEDTLSDGATAPTGHVGRQAIEERRASLPGRGLLELVQTQPGWLLEANGVLHPRGSEYDTQYVVDGFPVLDNRSPTFAPAFEPTEVTALSVRTAGYPAEYGRRLGGIVEVTTARDAEPGVHGSVMLQGGNLGTRSGSAAVAWVRGRDLFGASAQGGVTDRYLDPPVPENFSNRGSNEGGSLRWERDWTERDRLLVYGHAMRSGFLVPNDPEQQATGQRQDRRNEEVVGRVAYQRLLSARVMLQARGMVRDVEARLWSNPLSTPILADQDRGFRESYGAVAVTGRWRNHEVKAGTDVLATSVRESFGYTLTEPEEFDDDLPPAFRFADRRRGREHAAFVQDEVRWGRWSASAGLRWDRYRLLRTEQAVSPRLGLAWHAKGLTVSASYDRVFQTPAVENLLLASSPSTQQLTDETTGLPVPPSWGDFWQVGFAQALGGRVRVSASWFRRNIRNFGDDDVFLNTGVSFPIAFAGAEIHGVETRLEVPSWRGWTLLASWSNLNGTGRTPITGGLFLEEDDAELLQSETRFPISQDQRNTVYARVRRGAGRRVWVAMAAYYNSGLPVELEGEPEQPDARVLRRVNLERGRVRPSFSLDGQLSVLAWSRERQRVRVQADVMNITDRLNVINFAGLFSGTALGQPRTVSVRAQWEF